MVKSTKKNVKNIDSLHESYAKKMAMLEKQNEETMLKLQKDFTRDMIENFKSLLQDIEVATGLESGNHDDKFEKIKKEAT